MQQGYHPDESQSRQLFSQAASWSFIDHPICTGTPLPPPFFRKVFKNKDLLVKYSRIKT